MEIKWDGTVLMWDARVEFNLFWPVIVSDVTLSLPFVSKVSQIMNSLVIHVREKVQFETSFC